MPEKDLIAEKGVTTLSITGLLLGLLVNAVITIRLAEYTYLAELLKFLFLLDTGCLILSAAVGFASYIGDNNTGMILSQLWLAVGLSFISVTIALIITNSFLQTFLFVIIIMFLFAINLYIVLSKILSVVKLQPKESEPLEHS